MKQINTYIKETSDKKGFRLFVWGISTMILGVILGLLLILAGIIKLIIWDFPVWLFSGKKRRSDRRERKLHRIKVKNELKEIKKC